jgi:hypothetical protein
MTKPLEKFIQPLDKIVDESSLEKEQAAIDFCTLVEDAFLAHAGEVSVWKSDTLPAHVALRLQHELEDGSELWIGVDKEATSFDSELYTQKIFVQERAQKPDGKYSLERGFYYSFAPGALEILRKDEAKSSPVEIAFARRQEQEQLELLKHIENMTNEERMEARADPAHEQRRRELIRLERDIRSNYLPVDPGEIEGLRELVLSAGRFIPPMFRGITR